MLVLGGTGYIGQRIVHRLYQEGHALRVMTRRPHMAQAWLPYIEIVAGDAMSVEDLVPAMQEISHVIVCLRPAKDMRPKAQATLAMHILHAAVRAGVTHLTWIASEFPSLSPLKRVLRSHQPRIRICLLQSGPVLGSGSMAETAERQFFKWPAWLFRHRRGQRMVAIDQILDLLPHILRRNKTGQITLPKKSNPTKVQFQLSQNPWIHRQLKKGHPAMILWLLMTRLPYARGVWLYAQMAGPAAPQTFTPDTHITWQEALLYQNPRTWTEIPCPCSPKQQRWFQQLLTENGLLKPGQYRHHCRLVYQKDGVQVWQTQWRYPFGVRIVIAQHVQVSLVPAGVLGWVLGKVVARSFFRH